MCGKALPTDISGEKIGEESNDVSLMCLVEYKETSRRHTWKKMTRVHYPELKNSGDVTFMTQQNIGSFSHPASGSHEEER